MKETGTSEHKEDRVPARLVALKARGAERLLGKGDLLFSRGDRTLRLQAPYLTEAERRGILIGHRLRGAES
ncbi:MAG: hypothetical protein KIT09_35960 [Bryobacteraceae bacterium]|nr:hypothetical protein [Bryobacteraceae bacterium]